MLILLYVDCTVVSAVHLNDARTVLDCVASKTLWESIKRLSPTHWQFQSCN